MQERVSLGAIDMATQPAAASIARKMPIYQQGEAMPGVYLVTCPSGITLAAGHARFLPDWLEATDAAPDLEVFRDSRFAVS